MVRSITSGQPLFILIFLSNDSQVLDISFLYYIRHDMCVLEALGDTMDGQLIHFEVTRQDLLKHAGPDFVGVNI